MEPAQLAACLRGAIGFPVTPFRDDPERSVDVDAFAAHVDRVASGGLSAIVIAGGMGEFFSLTSGEITELTRIAVAAAAARIPVLVGVGGGPVEGRALARAARDAGVDGLVILPPNYPAPDPAGLVAYYQAIAEAVPDLAVILYSRGNARLTPEILRGLADQSNVVGMKDGHGDVRTFLRNRFALGDRYVWIAGTGDDLVGAYAAAGAQAYTSSIACFDPALSVELWRLADSGRFEELNVLLTERVLPWYELRSLRPGYEVAVMKAAMEGLGQGAGRVRPPLADLTPDVAAAVRSLADRLGTWRPAQP